MQSVSTSGAAITDLSITMTLNAGESVYVSFTCIVRCDGLSAEFYVYIDNGRTNGHTRITRDGVGGHLDYSAAIQNINNTLAVGSHTITIWGQTDDFSIDVLDCVLFVQTLTI